MLLWIICNFISINLKIHFVNILNVEGGEWNSHKKNVENVALIWCYLVFIFVQVVELLLMNGADVTLTNLDGENALEIAIIHGKK